MNIFLIGFMGSGKTFWGKTWAERTGMNFYDLDEMIEAEQGVSIAAIFENDGESYFRNLETSMLQRFADMNNCLLACGGGTPCFNHNIDWMNKNGITIYLSADPQIILNRIAGEKDKRPLISKLNDTEILSFIDQKLKEREPFYRKAKYILPVKNLNAESLSII